MKGLAVRAGCCWGMPKGFCWATGVIAKGLAAGCCMAKGLEAGAAEPKGLAAGAGAAPKGLEAGAAEGAKGFAVAPPPKEPAETD